MTIKKEYVSENSQLIKEWDWEKNIQFDPTKLTLGSDKKVWWKCGEEHEWQATIGNRRRGKGCPYCSGRVATQGKNDLLTVNPTLAKEWNYEKNGDLKAEQRTANSGRKVWWKCSKGHEWQATISSRNKGSGCPYCAGRDAIKGKNDLQTVNPTLAKEWNYEKNGDLKAEQCTANSGRKVWWKCGKGHEWQTAIYSRHKGSGCPYCSGRYPIKGENDLQTINPTLAKEWDYEKNNGLTPMDVMPNSHNKVCWKCSKGHKWRAAVSNRTKGSGCPYCAGQKVEKGENDLQTRNPTLAQEWNYERNGDLKPEQVTAHSGKKVWWRCCKGHEWQAGIIDRNRGRGCPCCAGQKVEKGENDLKTKNPTLAQEWNYERNGDLKPEQVTAHSGKKVWWRCCKGHEWQATVNNRNNGNGCPRCAKEKRKTVK